MNAAIDISSEVMRIMPEHVTPLWPQLQEIFAPVLANSATHTDEDIRRSLMVGNSQLWAQMRGDIVEAAATTEFVDYPKGIFVRVWLAGAKKTAKFNVDAFFEIIERWRQINRCIGIEASGRHGWLRKFPNAKVESLVMRLTYG